MDTISVLIGFLIGVVATAFAVEFGLKKIFRPPVQSKVTGSWRMEDHKAPLVVCQEAAGARFPSGAQVVTAGGADPEALSGRDFRRNPNARSNFVVEMARDRATLFLGPMTEGTLAVTTLDAAIVARLRAEHRRLWETGEPLVEETTLAEAVSHTGHLVRTRGRVQDSVPYRDRHLLRLTDGSTTLGVLVDQPLQLVGEDVAVMGRVVRGTTGYPLIDAEEVRVVAEEPRTRRASAARTSAPAGRSTTEAAPAAPPRPASAPNEARVMRVVDPKVKEARAAAAALAEEEREEEEPVEFEAGEEAATEAERGRVRANVVLRR